jgi:hypothetical protein
MYSLIHKVYFYAASGGEFDPKRFNERGSFALAAPGSMNFAFGGWVELVYPGIFKGLDQQ